MKTHTTFLKTLGSLALIMVLALSFNTSVYGQGKYKTFGVKAKRVTITDPGELYSTYELDADEKDEIMGNKKMSRALLNDIMEHSMEDSWSGCMKSLDCRIDHPDQIREYKAFKVAEFGNKMIVVIPHKYNQDVDEDFYSDVDFYIIIGKTGVE